MESNAHIYLSNNITALLLMPFFFFARVCVCVCLVPVPPTLAGDLSLSVDLSPCRFFLLMRVTLAVLVTFALCWLPFLSDLGQIIQVLRRIFPVARGLFEVQYMPPSSLHLRHPHLVTCKVGVGCVRRFGELQTESLCVIVLHTFSGCLHPSGIWIPCRIKDKLWNKG